MSVDQALTPRVFIVRHGETEWAMDGRFTGITDIALTEEGKAQVSSTSAQVVGKGRVIDVRRLKQVFVSPRKRAKETLELLLPSGSGLDSEKVEVTEEIAEWNYGRYEGLKITEIRQSRKESGLDREREWDIWKDGCREPEREDEGGESPQDITHRLDKLILRIREVQKPYMHGQEPADVLIVAHGLILRALLKRWIGWSLDRPLPMDMSPGAVAILSYKHNDVRQPSFSLGLAL